MDEGGAAVGKDSHAAPGEGAQGTADRDDDMGSGDAERAAAAQRFTDEHTVFVKGLRMGLQDGELEAHFRGQLGVSNIKEFRIARDSDGRFRVRDTSLAYMHHCKQHAWSRMPLAHVTAGSAVMQTNCQTLQRVAPPSLPPKLLSAVLATLAVS